MVGLSAAAAKYLRWFRAAGACIMEAALEQTPSVRRPAHVRSVAGWVLMFVLGATPVTAAELKAETVKAFERYARLTEARLDAELKDADKFLWLDRLPEAQRADVLRRLKQGETVIERLQTRENGNEIEIPSGMVHHWTGTVFIPGTTLGQVLALVQDYDNHQKYYAPDVTRSRTLQHDGDFFKIYLQFKKKKVITVVLNTEHEVRYTAVDATRVYSRSYTTRITELENHGEPDEREKPEGENGGFMWRLYSYWRFQERDGGVYLEAEAVSLTRGIPFIVAPIVKPFVTSVPRESLERTLTATRVALKSPPRPAVASGR
jgi:hypothetical protein